MRERVLLEIFPKLDVGAPECWDLIHYQRKSTGTIADLTCISATVTREVSENCINSGYQTICMEVNGDRPRNEFSQNFRLIGDSGRSF